MSMTALDWGLVIGGIVWQVGCGLLCSYVATEKGRDSVWFWIGLFFGVFALIAVAGLPALSKEEAQARLRERRERDRPEDPELQEWRRKMREKTI